MKMFLSGLLFLPLLFSCEREEEITCTALPIIDQQRYQDSSSDHYSFSSVAITGDCLTFNLQASGCSGEQWEVALLDAGILASTPEIHRFLKVELQNSEDCEALLESSYSFNLSGLQVKGESELVLDLEGLQQELTYHY